MNWLVLPQMTPTDPLMEGLRVSSSWWFTAGHLCGLSSGVRLSFVLSAPPHIPPLEPRLINDTFSGCIAHWHTSHTHAALISQWKWPGWVWIQNRMVRSCCPSETQTIVVKFGFVTVSWRKKKKVLAPLHLILTASLWVTHGWGNFYIRKEEHDVTHYMLMKR